MKKKLKWSYFIRELTGSDPYNDPGDDHKYDPGLVHPAKLSREEGQVGVEEVPRAEDKREEKGDEADPTKLVGQQAEQRGANHLWFDQI